MLTSDLYWRDNFPPTPFHTSSVWYLTEADPRLASPNVVALLRIIQPSRLFNEAVAAVIKFKHPHYLGEVFVVRFSPEHSCLGEVESPVFPTIDKAKAYGHMTCLLALKGENM